MSCTTTTPHLERKWEQPIAPGGADEYGVDLSWQLARLWESRDWGLGDTIRLANGFDAECVKAGRSGHRPPPWPSTLDREVPDGSAAWKIVAASSASLESVVTQPFVWEMPAGITESGGEDGSTRTVRLITVGADVAPGEYTILITGTCANRIIKQPCVLCVVSAEVAP